MLIVTVTIDFIHSIKCRTKQSLCLNVNHQSSKELSVSFDKSIYLLIHFIQNTYHRNIELKTLTACDCLTE